MVESETNKYTAFLEWCDQNGIKFPKLTFPSYFENGLIGLGAAE
jgi:hypothetical protein